MRVRVIDDEFGVAGPTTYMVEIIDRDFEVGNGIYKMLAMKADASLVAIYRYMNKYYASCFNSGIAWGDR